MVLVEAGLRQHSFRLTKMRQIDRCIPVTNAPAGSPAKPKACSEQFTEHRPRERATAIKSRLLLRLPTHHALPVHDRFAGGLGGDEFFVADLLEAG